MAGARPTRPPRSRKLIGDHIRPETHTTCVANGRDQSRDEAQRIKHSSPEFITTVRELWKRRQAWHKPEKSLTLQGKALCRAFVGGSEPRRTSYLSASRIADLSSDAAIVCMPILAARRQLEPMRTAVEKELERMLKDHPRWRHS